MVKIAKPLVTRADESPAYWQIGNLWQVMATGVQTDNAFTLIDQIVAAIPGGGPLTHTHDQDEGLYVISGKCTFNAGGHQGLEGPAGTLVCIPGKTEHSFTVDDPHTHVLNFYLPAGFEQLLIGVAHPALKREPPPEDQIAEMMAPRWLADKLSEDYGEANILGNPFADVPDPAKMMTHATPGATVFPFAANANSLPSLKAMNGRWTILASGPQTGGSYCMLEVTYEKGVFFAPRIYGLDKDEMFYLLEGEMTFLLGNRIEKVTAGAFIYVPSGNVYSARVDSTEARFLNLHTRAGFEELVEFLGKPSEASAAAPMVDYHGKQVDEGAKGRLLEKIGLTYLAVADPLDD